MMQVRGPKATATVRQALGNCPLIHCESTHFSPDVGGSPA
jgi:hypothetical protein